MAKVLFDKDDTELDGTDEVFTENVASTLDTDAQLLHYYNGTNVSVDVTIVASAAQDDAFDAGVQLSTETVSAGGNAGFYVVEDPWEVVEVTLSFGGDPTSGSVTVYRSDDN